MLTYQHILLVDDDPTYADLVKNALSACRTPCLLNVVLSGAELLNWLAMNRCPTVIFLDIHMPKSPGFDVLALLRSIERYKAIPIVLLSRSSGIEDVLKAYEIGANSFITKSKNVDELKRQLESFIHYWLNIVQTPGSSSWLSQYRYARNN